jgi:hypothetical protein
MQENTQFLAEKDAPFSDKIDFIKTLVLESVDKGVLND